MRATCRLLLLCPSPWLAACADDDPSPTPITGAAGAALERLRDGSHLLRVPGDAIAAANRVQESGLVVFAEPDLGRSYELRRAPRDPYYGLQWHLESRERRDHLGPVQRVVRGRRHLCPGREPGARGAAGRLRGGRGTRRRGARPRAGRARAGGRAGGGGGRGRAETGARRGVRRWAGVGLRVARRARTPRRAGGRPSRASSWAPPRQIAGLSPAFGARLHPRALMQAGRRGREARDGVH